MCNLNDQGKARKTEVMRNFKVLLDKPLGVSCNTLLHSEMMLSASENDQIQKRPNVLMLTAPFSIYLFNIDTNITQTTT